MYIGRTNSPIRRTYEHTLDKTWITTATRIDLEWVPADEVCELERRAIESERPRYNVVHNRGTVKVKIQAEVSLPDGNGLVAMVALGAMAVMSAKWGIEAFANWSVKRRADRAGVKLELPPVRNPFADGGPVWLQALLVEAMTPPGKFLPVVLPNRTGSGHDQVPCRGDQ